MTLNDDRNTLITIGSFGLTRHIG